MEEVEVEGGYRFGFNGKEKDNELKGDGNSYDFGSRTHDPRLGRWIALDQLTFLSPSKTPYGYAINNPMVMIDTDGEKEKPFENNKSQPITKKAGTETPAFIRNSRGEIIGFQPNAKQAYNCHSYAWHKSSGDISDPENSLLIQNGITKWDNNPADDIKSTQAKQLSNQDPNKTGDIVIYFLDNNNNGKYDDGEFIEHSAVVKDVDKDGNTITVIGKMGEDAISENHPAAPGYYQTDGDKKVSRAYFRLADNSPTKETQKEETKKEDTNQKPKFDVEVNKKNDTYVAPSPKIISEPK